MIEHLEGGLVAPPEDARPKTVGNGWFGARVVRRELPTEMRVRQTYVCRLFVEKLATFT